LRWLGYGGWAPFALALAWAVAGPHPELGVQVLRAYAISIVTFVGALSWAWALSLADLDTAQQRRLLVWSVTPSLLATASVMLPGALAWWALAAVYLWALRMDWVHNAFLRWPTPWLTLRTQLTAGAVIAMVLAAWLL
jgi:hypothetical protein